MKQVLLPMLSRTGSGVSAAFTPLDYRSTALHVEIAAMDPGTKLSVYLGQSKVGEEKADTAFVEEIEPADFAIRKAYLIPLGPTLMEEIDARFVIVGANVEFAASVIYLEGN